MSKTRSDKGKRRTRYGGKKIDRRKRKRRFMYETKKGHKTHIKLWWWERKAMSKEGYLSWSPKNRAWVMPKITKFGIVVLTPVDDITNQEKVERWAEEFIGFPGEFLIMGFSRTLRNKCKVKPVKLCRIFIRDTPDGMKAFMEKNYRFWRYWYWEKN